MRTLFAALIVAASAAGAWADGPEKTDLDRLQGTWKAKAGPNKDFAVVMEIKGHDVHSVITTPEGKEYKLQGQIQLDSSTTPKQLDWIKFARADGSEAEPNLAIYTLDGDTLKVCQGGPGRPRPTEFKSGDDGPPTILEFTRQKPKEGDGADLKGDLKAFQGKWLALIGPDKELPLSIEIEGHAVTASFTDAQGETHRLKGEIVLDESKTPRQVDWVKFTRPDGSAMEPVRGIYEFQDGAIRVCEGDPGDPRPTEFQAGTDGPPHLMMLRRDKAAK